jgi:hypothetical protein
MTGQATLTGIEAPDTIAAAKRERDADLRGREADYTARPVARACLRAAVDKMLLASAVRSWARRPGSER